MSGRVIGAITGALFVVFLLTEIFPGRHGAATTPVTATMVWRDSMGTAATSFDVITDFATCQEAQRQIAQRDAIESEVALACHRRENPRLPL